MQKILTNIIEGFLLNKLVNKHDGLTLINKILIVNNEEEIDILSISKSKTFNINKHLEYIEDLRQYFLKNGYENIMIENKINETLGFFIKSQNEISLTFKDKDKYEKLLLLSLIAYYIKTDKNALNIIWKHNTKYGEIKISINNAKPEKTQAQIISEKNYISKNINEPKCPICIENINFKGSLVKDSRENLRVVLVNIKGNDNDWFFQYSPYAYIKKHFVLNSVKHSPMVIDNDTIRNLVSFVDVNNNFFLGSNADLPIVGGSLLGHNHYQGGEDDLPIMNAKVLESFKFKETQVDILNWPLNAIKISSRDKEKIINISNFFVNQWKSNSDYGLKSINNSTTIIIQKTKNIFNVYLIFRNNSTSEEKPFGNFHILPSKFHIKQENIGLMEAGGLAILPKRLVSEVKDIIAIFIKDDVEIILRNEVLSKHYLWIKKMVDNKIEINKENLLKDMADIFLSCLEDCKVLSDNDFVTFIKKITKYNQEVFTIKNETGLEIEVINKGFTIKQIKNNNHSFLMEYENIDSYFLNNDIFLNSFVGPIAGRVEKGIIKLNKKQINLKTDINDNYIHGMGEAWSSLIFDIEIKSFKEFDLVSGIANQYNVELDCNFMIDIKLKIWRNKNVITFMYRIETNKTTICNPTHHLYWTIPNTKNIFDLNIKLNSKSYWNLNNNFNPYKKEGWLINDFIKVSKIKNKIGDEQIKLVGGGIDHPIELVKGSEIILSSPDYKYSLTADSTLSNIVMYTHNWKSLNTMFNLNDNNQQSLCFEYQEVPTSINNPNFEKITISKSKPYINSTTYKFKV